MFYIIDDGGEPLDCIYECLDAMDASTVEKRATEILNALGFNKQMQSKNTIDSYVGWRMCIALSRVVFINPTILMLDERTSHLGELCFSRFITKEKVC